MISCTEFIAAYSELFKYLDKRGGQQAVHRGVGHFRVERGVPALRAFEDGGGGGHQGFRVGGNFCDSRFARVAFPLTLTLSLGERAQPLDIFLKFESRAAECSRGFAKAQEPVLPLRSLGGRGEGRGEVRSNASDKLFVSRNISVKHPEPDRFSDGKYTSDRNQLPVPHPVFSGNPPRLI